jgi:hypothetical protein
MALLPLDRAKEMAWPWVTPFWVMLRPVIGFEEFVEERKTVELVAPVEVAAN